MRHILVRMLGAIFISALACGMAFGQAQGTSQINGVVKDPTGAVLPGVDVTATQTDTNISRQTVSDERGNFVLPNLPVGPYKVEVQLPGFRTFVQTGIQLGVNQNPNLNVILEVGQVTQEVEVQANVTMVETRNLGVRQVIENVQIVELPLQSRTAMDLITLQGGAVADPGNNSSSRALQGGVGVSITGLPTGATSFTLDGALHTNTFDSLNLPVPFPEALQEFSVASGSQNASSGFQGGAQVGAVTKSGTNQFHGDLFEYYRNDRFMARSYFAATKGSRTRQQFGGTFGGPIKKDKLFFFGALQYTKNKSAPTDNAVVVPTPAMLAGDFSEFVKVYTDQANQRGGCQGTPINNTGTGATPGLMRLTDGTNFINPARFNKTALALVKLLPQVNGMRDDTDGANALPMSMWADNPMQPGHSGPVGNDPCGRVWYTSPNEAHDSQIIGKVDYQRSAKNTIFARVFFTPQYTSIPNDLETKLLGFQNTANLGASGQDNIGSFYTIGQNYLLSPKMVNTLSMAVNRTFIRRIGPFAYDVGDLGINAYTYLPKTFEFGGLSGGGGRGAAGGQGGTGTDSSNNTNTANITDTLSWIKGNHQMSFGGSLAMWKVISYANVRSIPVYSFGVTTGDLSSTGLATADFLLGKFQSLRQASPNGLLMSQWYMGWHAEDKWNVTPRFTVSAGVRWEPYFPQQQLDGHIYNFSYDRMLRNEKSQVFLNAPPGFIYPGDSGFPNERAGMNKNWKTLGPRIGFGWDPKGDSKTSLRGSYGISYEFVNGQFHFNTNIAPPFGNDTIIRPGSTANISNPWADFPGGSGFAPGVSPFPYDNSTKNKNIGFAPGGVFISLPPDQPTTYIQTWNLTLQRQLPSEVFLSVQYTGNGTRNAWGTWPMNPAIFVPGTGTSTGGCMIPDGRGGTQSLLVAAGTVANLALARTSNQACSTTANTNFRRILALTNSSVGTYAADLDTFEAGNNGSYHALVVSVRRQASRNLNVNANYTWSHCIADQNAGLVGMPNVATGNTFVSINGKDPGTPSTSFFDANGNWLPGVTSLTASPAHREWNRTNCGTDRRQIFTATGVALVPKFENKLLRWVASDWSASSIFQYRTGSYLSVASGGDVALIGGSAGGQTAVQLSSDVYAPGKPSGPRAQYLNPVAGIFAAAANGTLAPNHGRNNIVGPSFWQWDAALTRNFRIGEGVKRIQARIEAYNVTNSFRPGNPSTALTGATYGQITGALAPRDIQFALKYAF